MSSANAAIRQLSLDTQLIVSTTFKRATLGFIGVQGLAATSEFSAGRSLLLKFD